MQWFAADGPALGHPLCFHRHHVVGTPISWQGTSSKDILASPRSSGFSARSPSVGPVRNRTTFQMNRPSARRCFRRMPFPGKNRLVEQGPFRHGLVSSEPSSTSPVPRRESCTCSVRESTLPGACHPQDSFPSKSFSTIPT
jgi:hypothetical protein